MNGKARDDSAVGRFWADALGWGVSSEGPTAPTSTWPPPLRPTRPSWSRLRDLGATPADIGQGDVPWRCLADPEGNESCVLGGG